MTAEEVLCLLGKLMITVCCICTTDSSLFYKFKIIQFLFMTQNVRPTHSPSQHCSLLHYLINSTFIKFGAPSHNSPTNVAVLFCNTFFLSVAQIDFL